MTEGFVEVRGNGSIVVAPGIAHVEVSIVDWYTREESATHLLDTMEATILADSLAYCHGRTGRTFELHMETDTATFVLRSEGPLLTLMLTDSEGTYSFHPNRGDEVSHALRGALEEVLGL